MARRSYISVTVDLADVMGELDDKDLLEELKARDVEPPTSSSEEFTSLVEEAYDRLQAGDVAEAELVLRRALYPLFPNSERCAAIYRNRVSPTKSGGET